MIITTPEQMRETAAVKAEDYAWLDHPNDRYEMVKACVKHIAAEIRAIPIAQQPVDDQDADMKRIAYKAGYVQAECGLPCPADIDKAFAAWLAEVATQPVAVTVDDLATAMFNEWKRVDPKSKVTMFPTSYMANFADMARVAIAAIQPADPLSDPRVVALVEAAQALGAMPEGYCFCSKDRIGDASKIHEPECRDLRAALRAIGGEA